MYKHVFRAVWRYFYDYISSTGNTCKAKIAQRIFCERVISVYITQRQSVLRK